MHSCPLLLPQSYAKLAYAPPKALLQLLRQQLMPQMNEVDPPQLAGQLLMPLLWSS